jgi:nitrate reductase NapE component
MNTAQFKVNAGERRALPIVFAVFFAVGLFGVIAVYAGTH